MQWQLPTKGWRPQRSTEIRQGSYFPTQEPDVSSFNSKVPTVFAIETAGTPIGQLLQRATVHPGHRYRSGSGRDATAEPHVIAASRCYGSTGLDRSVARGPAHRRQSAETFDLAIDDLYLQSAGAVLIPLRHWCDDLPVRRSVDRACSAPIRPQHVSCFGLMPCAI